MRLNGLCLPKAMFRETQTLTERSWSRLHKHARRGEMKSTLEFVVALTTGLLFSGVMIGAIMLGIGAV